MPPPPPPPLLLLLLLAVSSVCVDGGWIRTPASALQMLKNQSHTLPADVYKFDPISTGQQQYPDEVRYATLTDVSLCTCRHRCLADLRCMGYEHDKDINRCGLTDILLPGRVTSATVGEWSTGRRRGISWLGAPCHTDSDCSLLITGAECGPENVCACQRGWTPLDEMLCQPDEHWVQLNSALPDDKRLDKEMKSTSLQSCQDKCRDNIQCWAVEYRARDGACRLYGSAGQAAGQPLPAGTTAHELRLGRWVGSPPEGYTDIAGRLFHLTGYTPSIEAAEACLQRKGVRYVPDTPKLIKMIFQRLNITDRWIGVGFNDAVQENRFDTADGSTLITGSVVWDLGQPDNVGNEDCGTLSIEQKLNDLTCSMDIQHLCEYIGPILDHDNDPIITWDRDQDGALIWLTYDLGRAAASQPRPLSGTRQCRSDGCSADPRGRSVR